MNLPADLLRTQAYPELLPDYVELRETHISWVFLLDRDVFKLKKPVDFGFLDFRTQAARRAACEAEVRLNSRLSPEIYLGVLPVRRDADGRACVGGSGEIVDFAVHMRRLPDAARADLLLGAGKFSDAMLQAIAQRIATFHAAARCDAETSRFGSPAALAINVEENFAQTRETLHEYVDAETATEISRWQNGFLNEQRALFEQRSATGRVRDGHGDLRLEHIYLNQAPEPSQASEPIQAPEADPTRAPQIIDCIEFNDRFRFADVCADIAFLSMDLAFHGRVDLAERLLALYARDANDFDLYAVVDFYESYRAFVRGKIASIGAGAATLGEQRERKTQEARRYFLLALAAGRRSLLRPALVAVGGVIASGKSTLAARIGFEMSAPVIEADRTRKALLGVAATQPLHDATWQGAYDPTFSEQVYAEVLRRAGVVLASGRPVVVDASFRSVALRKAVRELAATHGVTFRFVECRAPHELCRARLVERERHAGVSDGRLAIFDEFCARYEPVSELPPAEHLILDTSRPAPDNTAAFRAELETWPQGFVA